MIEFSETLHPGYRQVFAVERVLHHHKTRHHELIIFDNPVFGRVLALDGVVQTTERDNHVYHEMLAHVPLFAHGAAREVLIVGGGDGGTLREVVKHRAVERITVVEIDARVIDLCRRYLPALSDGAFDDPRAEVVVADGAQFVRDTERRFDVIIVDSTDPVGPAEPLYAESFYAACRSCLSGGGVLVTQNGVPLFQADELIGSHRSLGRLFADAGFYFAAVPTYVGGSMAFGWASDDPALRHLAAADIRARLPAGLATRYYSPEIHAASFITPPEIAALLA